MHRWVSAGLLISLKGLEASLLVLLLLLPVPEVLTLVRFMSMTPLCLSVVCCGMITCCCLSRSQYSQVPIVP